MRQPNLTENISLLVNMGFAEADCRRELLNNNNNMESAIQVLVSQKDDQQKAIVPSNNTTQPMSTEDEQIKQAVAESLKEQTVRSVANQNSQPTVDLTKQDEETEIAKAIEASFADAKTQGGPTAWTTNPFDQQRETNQPAGLRNVGNTCYFNSLLQVYFHIPQLLSAVLAWQPLPVDNPQPTSNGVSATTAAVATAAAETAAAIRSVDSEAEGKAVYRKALNNMMKELRNLFALMLFSDRKNIDPTSFLNSVIDDAGNVVRIGEQQDVAEFNMLLLERIGDGLQLVNENKAQQEDKNLVRNLFYGTSESHTTAKDSEGKEIVQKNQTSFGQFILGVEEGDLHASIDSSSNSEVENYKASDKGALCTAHQTVWYGKFPPYLIVQLQRVQFDAVVGTAVKVNSRFVFDDELCLERYLFQNRDKSLELRGKMLELRKQREENGSQLKLLSNFKEGGLAKDKILELAAIAESEEKSPNQQHLDHLKNRTKEAETAIQELTATEQKLAEDLKSLFHPIEQKTQPHRLLAVLVHGGAAQSGHYFAYIRNKRCDGEWWCFSDMRVTPADKDTVFEKSFGGSGQDANAYCLFFERPTQKTPAAAPGLESLAQDLKQLIKEHNDGFLKEKQDWSAKRESEEVTRRVNDFIRLLGEERSRGRAMKDHLSRAYFCYQMGREDLEALVYSAGAYDQLAKEPGTLAHDEVSFKQVMTKVEAEIEKQGWMPAPQAEQRLETFNVSNLLPKFSKCYDDIVPALRDVVNKDFKMGLLWLRKLYEDHKGVFDTLAEYSELRQKATKIALVGLNEWVTVYEDTSRGDFLRVIESEGVELAASLLFFNKRDPRLEKDATDRISKVMFRTVDQFEEGNVVIERVLRLLSDDSSEPIPPLSEYQFPELTPTSPPEQDLLWQQLDDRLVGVWEQPRDDNGHATRTQTGKVETQLPLFPSNQGVG